MKALRGYGRKGDQQAEPGSFSTGSGVGKDSWPGLCSTGLPSLTLGGIPEVTAKVYRLSKFHNFI